MTLIFAPKRLPSRYTYPYILSTKAKPRVLSLSLILSQGPHSRRAVDNYSTIFGSSKKHHIHFNACFPARARPPQHVYRGSFTFSKNFFPSLIPRKGSRLVKGTRKKSMTHTHTHTYALWKKREPRQFIRSIIPLERSFVTRARGFVKSERPRDEKQSVNTPAN